jgi:hemerythrin-like domain-containing protein
MLYRHVTLPPRALKGPLRRLYERRRRVGRRQTKFEPPPSQACQGVACHSAPVVETREVPMNIPQGRIDSRRSFIQTSISGAGLVLLGCGSSSKAAAKAPSKDDDEGDAEVTPGEDLMQEHGVLERVLLVYGAAATSLERGESLDVALITSAAGVIRHFVEDYHEKNEEQFIFPRLESAKREVELVATLRRQHQRGRDVTDEITRIASSGTNAPALVPLFRAFERMYRPHAAREDTVVFPTFRELIGRDAYRELGEKFEDDEHARLGEHGFENAVAEVARLETALGINDLAKFTP